MASPPSYRGHMEESRDKSCSFCLPGIPVKVSGTDDANVEVSDGPIFYYYNISRANSINPRQTRRLAGLNLA